MRMAVSKEPAILLVSVKAHKRVVLMASMLEFVMDKVIN